MTKMPTPFKYRNRVWSLFGCIGVLLCSYLLLVGMTVYNTLEAQSAERSIATITADLSRMEFAYLNSQSKINIDLASSMGFIEPENVIVAKVSVPFATAYVSKSKI